MTHLLLLHGAIGAKDQFGRLEEKLKDDFVVHSLNFSGHGGQPLNGDFSIKGFADDVLRYLSAQNIEKIDIFGYSMGGYVALYLAKHYPEKVGKVFTLATKFDWAPEIAAREVKMLDAEKIAEKVPAFAKQLEARHHPLNWKTILTKTAEMMLAMGDDNPLKPDDFHNINHKIQIGLGDKDAMVTFEETVAVYRALPNAGFIILPDTPHPLEKVPLGRLVSEVRIFFS